MRQELPHRPWMEHSPQQNLVSVVPTLAVIFFKMHFLSLLSVYHSCFLLHNAVMLQLLSLASESWFTGYLVKEL